MKTTDINLAAFLKIKGFECTVHKNINQGVFEFDDIVSGTVNEFYNSEFQSFANTQRSLKSQVINLPNK